jgi:hypothetical protein
MPNPRNIAPEIRKVYTRIHAKSILVDETHPKKEKGNVLRKPVSRLRKVFQPVMEAESVS